MMNSHAFLVVMAGGSGTRFWPKSTSKKPKQLLSFGAAKETLLQQTLNRFSKIAPREQQIIVTTQSLSKSVADQAQGVSILAEPQGRNTAPCVYWAAREVFARDPKGVMFVMPSDHYMAVPDRFSETVSRSGRMGKHA